MKPVMFVRIMASASGFATDFRPQARILKTGGIVLNASAANAMAIGDSHEIILYWYADLGHIGMRPAREGDPPGARFLGRVNKSTISFRAKLFLQHFRVDIAKAAGTYPVAADDHDMLWIIPLPAGSTPRMVDASAIKARLAGARANGTGE